MSLPYKFIVFNDNIALFVNMNEVTYEVNQEDNRRNNIRGNFLDIEELEGYQCSLKEDEVGLYLVGGLWWSEQGSFAINGEVRERLTIRCLYPERLDDIPVLYKYLDLEVSEEDAERYEAEEIERTREKEIVKVAGDIAGEGVLAKYILDDFRNYDLVNGDIKHINSIDLDSSSIESFIDRAEYPLDYAERFGPKWSIEYQLPDTKVIPLTTKNIRMAGDLIPINLRQWIEKPLNNGRYCLVIGFRHIHRKGYERERCCTTLILLESKKIKIDDVVEYSIENFSKSEKALQWTCDFLSDVGRYKAFAMLYGKSQHRFKTNSLTLSPQELTFPVITGKTVWIVEGQNDALALYHWMRREEFRESPDIVLNLGTANLRVFDRTDLPMFCPRSTNVIMFLDNVELNIEAAKVLYLDKGFKRINLASDRFPFLEIEKEIDLESKLKEDYSKAQKFISNFVDINLDVHLKKELNNSSYNRKEKIIIGDISLKDIPYLSKNPSSALDFDADDFVNEVENWK